MNATVSVFVSTKKLEEILEAFQWCSGSADFGAGGQAHEGWSKIVQPLMDWLNREIKKAGEGEPLHPGNKNAGSGSGLHVWV